MEPNEPNSYAYKAFVLAESNQVNEAISNYDKSIQLDSKSISFNFLDL